MHRPFFASPLYLWLPGIGSLNNIIPLFRKFLKLFSMDYYHKTTIWYTKFWKYSFQFTNYFIKGLIFNRYHFEPVRVRIKCGIVSFLLLFFNIPVQYILCLGFYLHFIIPKYWISCNISFLRIIGTILPKYINTFFELIDLRFSNTVFNH